MIDLGIIGLGISVTVAAVNILGYLNTKAVRKEISDDKFAQAASVNSELIVIRDDIARIDTKLEDYGSKISAIQIQNAICENQHEHTSDNMNQQIKALEKIVEKIDDLR